MNTISQFFRKYNRCLICKGKMNRLIEFENGIKFWSLDNKSSLYTSDYSETTLKQGEFGELPVSLEEIILKGQFDYQFSMRDQLITIESICFNGIEKEDAPPGVKRDLSLIHKNWAEAYVYPSEIVLESENIGYGEVIQQNILNDATNKMETHLINGKHGECIGYLPLTNFDIYNQEKFVSEVKKLLLLT